MSVKQLDSSSFDKAVAEKGVVMVEFFAPWCGHCRMFSPIIEEACQDFAGDAKIYQVNTDNNKDLAVRFEIESIPTVIWFKDGNQKDIGVGVVSKEEIKNKIESYK